MIFKKNRVDGKNHLSVSIFSSAGSRLVNLVIGLLIVPLTVMGLSPVDYGLLALAVSFSILVSYADLGMGAAIINLISGRQFICPGDKSHKAVSTIFFSLCYFSFLILAIIFLFWIGLVFFDKETRLLNVIFFSLTLVVLGIPSGLIQRIMHGLQLIHKANIWMTLGRSASLLMVYLLSSIFKINNLWLYIFAILGIPIFLSWISFFSFKNLLKRNYLFPMYCYNDISLIGNYGKIGLSFLVLQLVGFIEGGIDPIVISWAMGSEFVQSYDIGFKLYGYLPALISVAAFPIWPAITKAHANSDFLWIVDIFKKGTALIISWTIFFAILIGINFQNIVELWVGRTIKLGGGVIVGLSLYSVLASYGLFQAMFLNGLNKIKEQVRIYIPYITVILILKVLVVRFFGLGLDGLIWVLNLVYIWRIYRSHTLIAQFGLKNV